MKPDLAVTISSGPAYAAMAELVLPRIPALLGLDVSVELLDPVTAENGSRAETRRANTGNCCRVKLELLERYPGKRILFFDLDLVPLRPWDWSEVPDGFCAVRNTFNGRTYLNGGLWIAGPEHVPVFRRAREMWAVEGDPKQWGWEETFLQRALDEAGVDVQWLPPAYNLQIGDLLGVVHEDTLAAHACLARRKAETVRALCEAYPLPEVAA